MRETKEIQEAVRNYMISAEVQEVSIPLQIFTHSGEVGMSDFSIFLCEGEEGVDCCFRVNSIKHLPHRFTSDLSEENEEKVWLHIFRVYNWMTERDLFFHMVEDWLLAEVTEQ